MTRPDATTFEGQTEVLSRLIRNLARTISSIDASERDSGTRDALHALRRRLLDEADALRDLPHEEATS